MKHIGHGFIIILIISASISFVFQPSINSTSFSDPKEKFLGEIKNYAMGGELDDTISKEQVLVVSSSSNSLVSEFYLKAKVGERYFHFLPFQSRASLRKIASNPTVISILPDIYINQTTQSFTQTGSIGTNSLVAKDIMGLEGVWKDYNVTGDGVKLGIVDSGVDFGQSDLIDSPLRLSSGITASFDASGNGLAYSNTTLKAFTELGKTYLPLENSTIYGRIGETGELVSNIDLGLQLENLEITNITHPSKSGNYRVGLIIQYGQVEGIANQFFIFVLTDYKITGIYDTMYIDYDTSLAISLARNGDILANGEKYLSLVKWSIKNEVPVNSVHPIAAKDIDGDGINDISAGALATTIIRDRSLSTKVYARGINPDGKLVGLMYDTIGHGTASAASAAGRGIYRYPIFDDKNTKEIENSTLYSLPGSAPHASVLATKWSTLNDAILSWFWTAGMEFDSLGNLDVVDTEHVADITSNSWGLGNIASTGAQRGMDIYSLLLDLMSAPNLLYSGYQGMLFVVSAGNGGSGSGTVATPASASMALTIGSSNNYIFLENNGRNDVSFFSSRGPTPYGAIKPDLVTPGNTGYTLHTLSTASGNGTYSTGTFGGTSEAGPRGAGVVALMYEAIRSKSQTPDLGTVRTILKSTATDLGFEVTAQGAGLINAYDAVGSVLGNNWIIASNTYNSKNLGEKLQDAFKLNFGNAFDHPLYSNPIPDTFLSVDSQDLLQNIDFTFSYGNGTTANISSLPVSFKTMNQFNSTNFKFSSKGDEFTEINLEPYLPENYRSSDLLHISLSLTKQSWENLLQSGLTTPDLLLYDQTTGKIVYDIMSQRTWVQQLYSGKPIDDFLGSAYLKFSDPGYVDSVPGWKGLDYLGYAQAYSYQEFILGYTKTDNKISISESKILQSSFPTLFVGDQKFPIFINLIDNVGLGINAHEYPVLNENTIYRQDSVFGTLDWGYRPENGDFRYYEFSVPVEATYFAVQVAWNASDMIADAFLFNSSGVLIASSDVTYIGGGVYESSTSEEGKQNLLVHADTQTYYLMLHFAQMPFSAEPQEFTVFSRYLTLDEIPKPEAQFSQDISGSISGQLLLNVSDYHLDDFPELKVSTMDISPQQGRNGNYTNKLQSNNLEYGLLSDFIYAEDVQFLEFYEGEKVNLFLEWEGDFDLDIYVLDINSEGDFKIDELQSTGTSPYIGFEVASFAAKNSGFYGIYIDVYNGSGPDVSYTLHWESRNGPIIKSNTNSASVDTPYFPDGEYSLAVYYNTNFGIKFEDRFDILLENHDNFTSSLVSPINGDVLDGSVLVEWSASTSVLARVTITQNSVSEIIANGVTESSVTFDSSLFTNGPVEITVELTNGIFMHTYYVMVEFDNIFTSSLQPIETSNNSLPIDLYVVAFAFLPLFWIRKKKE